MIGIVAAISLVMRLSYFPATALAYLVELVLVCDAFPYAGSQSVFFTYCNDSLLVRYS